MTDLLIYVLEGLGIGFYLNLSKTVCYVHTVEGRPAGRFYLNSYPMIWITDYNARNTLGGRLKFDLNDPESFEKVMVQVKELCL